MIVLSEATSALMEKAFTGLVGVLQIIATSKTRGKELKEKLLQLKPTIAEISTKISESESSPDRGKQFEEFHGVLQDGLYLVEKLEKIHSLDIFRKYRYGKRIRKFQNKVYDFILTQGSPNLALDLCNLNANFRGFSQQFERNVERIIENATAKMTSNSISNTIMLEQISKGQVFHMSIDGMHEAPAAQQSICCTDLVPEMPNFAVGLDNPQVPEMPNFVVGLDNPINDVKQILFQNDVNIVGVTGMGGSGKTTLASAISNDIQVQKFFQNNIIFISVSQTPNVKGLLETMWDKIIGGRRPEFQSTEDAHNQLQNNLRLRTYRPTLVVLDDVWSRSNLENFLFDAKGYKTIFTTRHDSTFPKRKNARLYKIRMLEDTNDLSLFCFWAFGETSIPPTEREDLVKQVAAECKGLPLALKVIGSCLHGEPHPAWESAKGKLSRAEPISEYHTDDLFNRLKMSIDILDDESKQCFLDLGAFPKGRKFSVNSLLDIWVYVRGMEWQDAFMVLLELAKRNLLNLTSSDPGNPAISHYRCASELCFSQHDVMRDLACRLASQDSIIHCERLFMTRKEARIPTKWVTTLKDQPSGARFLSIHTDEMEKQDWCQIDFPEVEALALFFAASQYCLPTFLHTMPKLKVVIIYNYSPKRAVLHGLSGITSFTQIKSLLFERLTVPSLYEYCRAWESLEKLSVSLCEGLGKMTLLDTKQVLRLPKFVEINLDHCSDLEELPEKLSNLTSLQRLSVTNCHLIEKLPDELGSLRSLRVLRLCACPGLTMLPPSICKLEQLEFLDISLCRCLKDLPMEFDQLPNLNMLDMRECSGLKTLPKTFARLGSLKRVICDENSERQWRSIKASTMPHLTIDAREECFNLDWLDD